MVRIRFIEARKSCSFAIGIIENTVGGDTTLDAAFVHSRARVAIANTKDGGVAVLQWSGTQRVTTLGTTLGHVTLAVFSRSGDRAAISDGSTIEAWSTLTGDPV